MMAKILQKVYLYTSVLLFFITMVVLLPVLILPFALLGEKKGGRIAYFFMHFWAMSFTYPLGIRYRVIGREKIDPNATYVYTCNHRSYMDSPAMVYAIPGQFRPLGKVEITKAPIFGYIYKHVVVTVDRANAKNRLSVFHAMKEKIMQGISMLVFPEGSINKTSQPLTPFHDGAFRLAIETQVPILPMAMFNSATVLPPNKKVTLHRGVITVVFSDPIPTQGLNMEDLPALKNQVYERMQQMLIANKAYEKNKRINFA